MQHGGRIQFTATPRGGTRVHVELAYNPIARGLGHVPSRLLGHHPKKLLDEDLVRMKTAIETGKRPHDAAQSVA
ncbi:MAG: hypothetical protein ACRD0G_09500 [Acidimicrobiales bacterium]